MELIGLDLCLFPCLCAPKQADRAFLQVSSSDWDMNLEAMISGGGPWWLLRRGPKTMVPVAAWLGGLSCSHPHPIRGPSLPPGPEGAAFSGPPPPGTTRALALGLRGIKESLSALAQDTCTVHTQALMTFNTCLSQPRSPAPALGVPSPVFPAQRPSSCPLRSMQLGRPGASGVCPCYLPSHIEGGSCRGLIPLGTGTIQSGPPPSCSVWS